MSALTLRLCSPAQTEPLHRTSEPETIPYVVPNQICFCCGGDVAGWPSEHVCPSDRLRRYAQAANRTPVPAVSKHRLVLGLHAALNRWMRAADGSALLAGELGVRRIVMQLNKAGVHTTKLLKRCGYVA